MSCPRRQQASLPACSPHYLFGQFAGRIGVDLKRKMSLRLQFMDGGPCGCSRAPVFLNLLRLANPSLKYANVRRLSDLRAVDH